MSGWLSFFFFVSGALTIATKEKHNQSVPVRVFPARAGVNRKAGIGHAIRLGVPRASGGKPDAEWWLNIQRECSPR